MSSSTMPEVGDVGGVADVGCTVLDPTLRRWQRRYFHQPALGPGHRAFTAAGAARGRAARGRIARLRDSWDAACDRETATRNRAIWP